MSITETVMRVWNAHAVGLQINSPTLVQLANQVRAEFRDDHTNPDQVFALALLILTDIADSQTDSGGRLRHAAIKGAWEAILTVHP